jgi:hypothetical protein
VQLGQCWCFGGEAFRREWLEQMEGKVGQNHPGKMRLESAGARAGGLRSSWPGCNGPRRVWLRIAKAIRQKWRWRRETTLTLPSPAFKPAFKS